MKINSIKPERALSQTQIGLADFVINPYRGCEFGCLYCYSQENKNIKKRKEKWGKFLDLKINLSGLLSQELERIKPQRVLLGSTTECFQPQEAKFKLTKNILNVLKEKNIPVVILTKSNLIEKYIDLLNYNSANKIYFTFMFTKDKIRNIFEVKTPSLRRRIETIKKLIANKIEVKIHIGPFIRQLEKLEHLFKLIPPEIKEVEIEIYNSKMGNFKEIVKAVRQNLSSIDADCLEHDYCSKDNYARYCTEVKTEAEDLGKQYGFRVNIITPEFNSWYSHKIKYE